MCDYACAITVQLLIARPVADPGNNLTKAQAKVNGCGMKAWHVGC